MKKLLLVFLGIVSVTACKTETNDKSDKSVKTKEIKRLIVDFSFKTDKIDNFRIMLNNIEIDEFQKMNIQVYEEVGPSSSYESINAIFPENHMSNNIVVNLGSKETKEVQIQKLRLSYGENTIEVTIDNIENYFSLNKFIELDKEERVLRTKKIDGAHNPILFSRKSIINLLKRRTNG